MFWPKSVPLIKFALNITKSHKPNINSKVNFRTLSYLFCLHFRVHLYVYVPTYTDFQIHQCRNTRFVNVLRYLHNAFTVPFLDYYTVKYDFTWHEIGIFYLFSHSINDWLIFLYKSYLREVIGALIPMSSVNH